MTAVACGMADDGAETKINPAYQRYVWVCKGLGLKPMSEFEWINMIVIGRKHK